MIGCLVGTLPLNSPMEHYVMERYEWSHIEATNSNTSHYHYCVFVGVQNLADC